MQYPGFICKTPLPALTQVIHFTEELLHYLFPITEKPEEFLEKQEAIQISLQTQLTALIRLIAPSMPVNMLVTQYFELLESVKNCLINDAQFILSFDPAAYSLEEVLASYPGFKAICIHRLAHPLYAFQLPILPRMMSEWAHSKTGIDIHPGASIGCPFFIDHGTGVVIGETTVIGSHVRIYQGVTLGALAVKKEQAHQKRHPTVENNVIIYAGSTILGGTTIIGHDSIIGGNTWVTESVPPFSFVYTKSETIVNDRKDFIEPINFII